MVKLSTLSLILIALYFSATTLLFAQAKSKNHPLPTHPLPTKEKAVHHVKQETGGRILDVKQRLLKSGANVWRVKFLKEGRIQFMDVAPQTFTD